MANTEWKNREERKGLHDKISWENGWISGYLSRPIATTNELLKSTNLVVEQSIRQDATEKVLNKLDNDIPVWLFENPESTVRELIDFLIDEIVELHKQEQP